MNADLKNISKILVPAITRVGNYLSVIFIVLVLGLYGYLILHVSSLTQIEVDQTQVLERLQATKRSQVDQRAVDRILLLQDQNVQIDSIFEEARQNPFSE